MNRTRIQKEKVETREFKPVSVKTRIGFDHCAIEEWAQHLLETEPACISIHGRTLKQMYTGHADWEAIGRAVQIAKGSQTLMMGNGDLNDAHEIVKRIRETGVDGVLLGRGSLGNPWIFSHKDWIRQQAQQSGCLPEKEEWVEPARRFRVLLEHARYFEEVRGVQRFAGMRKHFGWYCKGLPKAAELRNRMCQTKNSNEVALILDEYSREFQHLFSP